MNITTSPNAFIDTLTDRDFDQLDLLLVGLCGRLGLHPVELLSLRFGPGLGTLVPLDRVGRMRGELASKDILTPAMLRWLRRADCPTRVQVDLRDGTPLSGTPEDWDFPDHEPVAREQLLWASEWSNSLWLQRERKPAPDLPVFDPYAAGESETAPVPSDVLELCTALQTVEGDPVHVGTLLEAFLLGLQHLVTRPGSWEASLARDFLAHHGFRGKGDAWPRF